MTFSPSPPSLPSPLTVPSPVTSSTRKDIVPEVAQHPVRNSLIVGTVSNLSQLPTDLPAPQKTTSPPTNPPINPPINPPLAKPTREARDARTLAGYALVLGVVAKGWRGGAVGDIL